MYRTAETSRPKKKKSRKSTYVSAFGWCSKYVARAFLISASSSFLHSPTSVTLAEASGSSEAFSDIRREAFGFLMRFCECADQENGPTIVNGVGDKRAVRMIGVLLGNGAQGSGCVPCCERPRLLSMGGALYARVVQKGRSLHFRAVGQGMALIFGLFFYCQFISSHISSRFSFV